MAEYEIDRLLGDGQRPIRVIPFPGERGKAKDVSVGIWVLSDGETREARGAALKWLVDKSGLSELHLAHDTGNLLDLETKTQILFRALRDPKQPARAFASSEAKLRDGLTNDEIQALFNDYNSFCDARSPLRRIQSDQELDALVNSLGKGWEDETSLESYDTVSLRRIVRSLAIRCLQLTRESSSSSLSLSDTNG